MFRRLSFGLLVCAALSACGGSGGSTTPPAPIPLPTAGTQSVTISIGIPAATRGGSITQRRPLYVSSNTQSATISINGGTRTVVNLSPTSKNCEPATGGGRTCTLAVNAPVGADTFAEVLYGTTDGTGAPLSQNSTSATIVAGKANVVNLTLDGIVASVTLTLANTTPPVGTSATIGLGVNLNDASGATIIGNDQLANPVTLSNSDTSGITTLSKVTLNTPADASAVTVAYTGQALSSAVFTAKVSGVADATATLTPSGQSTGAVQFNDYTTFGFDNQRDSFNPNSTAITPKSVANLHLAWQALAGGNGDYNMQSQAVLATEIPNHAGVLFVGGGSGYVDAHDALTGKMLWSVSTGQETYSCDPSNAGNSAVFGVGGTAAFDAASNSLYVVANKNGAANSFAQNLLLRLDPATGKTLNSYDFGAGQAGFGELNFSHTSITVSNGIAYVGTGATCDIPSWRGRVAGVRVPAMTNGGTFFTVWNPTQQQSWSGGGVWGWGGVAIDFAGNVLAGVGNTDVATGPSTAATGPSPFIAAPAEFSGYGESLLELRSDLSQAVASNHPIAASTYAQAEDLDVNGTPVVFQPAGAGCDPMVALQSKAGALMIYDELNISSGPRAQYQFAPSAYSDGFLGVTAYSRASNLLYSVVASNQSPDFLAPGLVAVNPGCGTPSIAWHATFGPDGTQAGSPRGVPAVSAGGVVFVATPCNSGSCPTVGTGGAVWELDAASGTILNGGNPIVYTNAPVRAPATIDGNWVYIVDTSGDLYGMTIDPNYAKISAVKRAPDARLFNRIQARPMHMHAQTTL